MEIDERDDEHWLLTDGLWVVRLDLLDGTLLGGPVLLQHDIQGFASAEAKIATLRRLAALADRGRIPKALLPRKARAARWIMELRTADAIMGRATHQEMARVFYAHSITSAEWRARGDPLRLRVQRLVRSARQRLADPLRGPWFS